MALLMSRAYKERREAWVHLMGRNLVRIDYQRYRAEAVEQQNLESAVSAASLPSLSPTTAAFQQLVVPSSALAPL